MAGSNFKILAQYLAGIRGRVRRISSKMRARWLPFSNVGVIIARDITIGPHSDFRCTDGGALRIGKSTDINADCSIIIQRGRLEIGDHVFIGRGCTIVARESVEIGSHCLIAERVTIRDQDHRIHGDPAIPIRSAGMESAPIKIGNDVWIGAGAVVLKGTTIGDGAVVAANAVVNRNVAENEIVGGVPARHIGMRKIQK